MSRPSSDDPLRLLSQKAVYDISAFLTSTPDGATADQIRKAIRRNPLPVLRELAIGGFVSRNGSWDSRPDMRTLFTLTSHGRRLRGQLNRLDEWARQLDT
jgi:hypothetical protein